jgi:hypothetical protein
MIADGYVSAAALHQAEDLLINIEQMGPAAAPAFIARFEQVLDDGDVSHESRTLARLLLGSCRVIRAGGNWRDAELALVRETVRRQKLGVAA